MAVKQTLLILLAFFFAASGIMAAEPDVPLGVETPAPTDTENEKTQSDELYDSITWEDVIEDEEKPDYEAHYVRRVENRDGSSQILTASSSRKEEPKTFVVLDP